MYSGNIIVKLPRGEGLGPVSRPYSSLSCCCRLQWLEYERGKWCWIRRRDHPTHVLRGSVLIDTKEKKVKSCLAVSCFQISWSGGCIQPVVFIRHWILPSSWVKGVTAVLGIGRCLVLSTAQLPQESFFKSTPRRFMYPNVIDVLFVSWMLWKLFNQSI